MDVLERACAQDYAYICVQYEFRTFSRGSEAFLMHMPGMVSPNVEIFDMAVILVC